MVRKVVGRPLVAGVLFGLALGLGGCSDAGSDCSPGTEACACYAGNVCLTGLMCVSGYCVDPAGGDGDAGDGDPQPDVGACEDLLDCVSAAMPESLSTYAMQYGMNGTCFSIPDLTPADCYAECRAQLDMLAEQYENVVECGPPNCGDGLLDHDEQCDGTSGCAAACNFSDGSHANECNPVNGAGCEDGFCDWSFASAENYTDVWWECWSVSPVPGPAAIGEACGDGIACADPHARCTSIPSVCGEGRCCVETCYLGPTNDADFGCAEGTTCVTYLEADDFWDIFSDLAAAPGTEYFGMCI